MSLWTRIKGFFGDYLDRMASENKKLFGDSRPDCCKLNGKSTLQKRK